MNQKQNKWTKELLLSTLNRYESGEKIATIAHEFGISTSRVKQVLKLARYQRGDYKSELNTAKFSFCPQVLE